GLRRSAPEQPPAGSAHAVRLDSITARVSALSVSGGSPVLELDNGQVWRVLEGEQWLVRAGDAVVISRAAFGSFRIRAPGGRVAKSSGCAERIALCWKGSYGPKGFAAKTRPAGPPLSGTRQ